MLSVAYRSIAPSLLPGLKASVIMDYESRRETKPFRALEGDCTIVTSGATRGASSDSVNYVPSSFVIAISP